MATTLNNLMGRAAPMAASILLAGALSAAAPAQDLYDFRDLGTLGRDSEAISIDENGLVVGWSEVAGEAEPRSQYYRHAFLWRSQMQDLGTLGGRWSVASDINFQADVVGKAETHYGVQHAFLHYGATMYDLNDLLVPEGRARGAITLVEANAINDDLKIVACGLVGRDPEMHAFLLVPTGGEAMSNPPTFRPHDLGRLPGGGDCLALGINETGEAVGMSGETAWHMRGRVMQPLESALGYSRAVDVNDWGTAVGVVGGSGWETMVATLWNGEFSLQLETPRGWMSEATAVNDGEFVVGWTAPRDSGPDGREAEAMMWFDGTGWNLNDHTVLPDTDAPVITLERANAIDDTGRIVGCWRRPDGSLNAFLLTPIAID